MIFCFFERVLQLKQLNCDFFVIHVFVMKKKVVKMVVVENIFSPNRPTRPIRSSSRDVHPLFDVCVLFSPSHAIF